MQHKIVAKLKGRSYSSVSFIIDNPAALNKLFEVLDGLQMAETSGFSLPDGYKSVTYADGPLSLTLESNIEVYDEEEVALMREIEKDHLATEEEKKKAEPAE